MAKNQKTFEIFMSILNIRMRRWVLKLIWFSWKGRTMRIKLVQLRSKSENCEILQKWKSTSFLPRKERNITSCRMELRRLIENNSWESKNLKVWIKKWFSTNINSEMMLADWNILSCRKNSWNRKGSRKLCRKNLLIAVWVLRNRERNWCKKWNKLNLICKSKPKDKRNLVN